MTFSTFLCLSDAAPLERVFERLARLRQQLEVETVRHFKEAVPLRILGRHHAGAMTRAAGMRRKTLITGSSQMHTCSQVPRPVQSQ